MPQRFSISTCSRSRRRRRRCYTIAILYYWAFQQLARARGLCVACLLACLFASVRHFILTFLQTYPCTTTSRGFFFYARADRLSRASPPPRLHFYFFGRPIFFFRAEQPEHGQKTRIHRFCPCVCVCVCVRRFYW